MAKDEKNEPHFEVVRDDEEPRGSTFGGGMGMGGGQADFVRQMQMRIRRFKSGCIFAVLFFIFTFFVGLYTIVKWLFSWLR